MIPPKGRGCQQEGIGRGRARDRIVKLRATGTGSTAPRSPGGMETQDLAGPGVDRRRASSQGGGSNAGQISPGPGDERDACQISAEKKSAPWRPQTGSSGHPIFV